MTYAWIDTETTGLDPDFHEIWEVGLILWESDNGHTGPGVTSMRKPRELAWQLPVDLGRADPMSLAFNRFHERRDERFRQEGGWGAPIVYPTEGPSTTEQALDVWCAEFTDLTRGAHVLGMVPSFDTDRLWRLLRRNGACPMWHYQPVDVEAVAAGFILGTIGDSERGQTVAALPWDSDALSLMLGLDPDNYDRHTALGDCRWARDLWVAIHEGAGD